MAKGLNVGSVYMSIGGDTAGFNKAMSDVERTIKTRMMPTFRMASMAATGIGAAVTGAAAASIRSFLKMGDEIHKMALRTGFSATTLSELSHAANLSDASLRDVERAAKRMAKTVQDASDGMATYVRTFEHLGLNVADLKAMKPEDAFMALMEALAGVENEMERAAHAQNLFGRAGTGLLPMLEDGVEGLRRVRDEVYNLNLAMDMDTAKFAAEFLNNMGRIKGAFRGFLSLEFGKGLVAEFGPGVERFAQWAGSADGRAFAKDLAFGAQALVDVVVRSASIIKDSATSDSGFLSGVISAFKGESGAEASKGLEGWDKWKRRLIRAPLLPFNVVAAGSRHLAQKGTVRDWEKDRWDSFGGTSGYGPSRSAGQIPMDQELAAQRHAERLRTGAYMTDPFSRASARYRAKTATPMLDALRLGPQPAPAPAHRPDMSAVAALMAREGIRSPNTGGYPSSESVAVYQTNNVTIEKDMSAPETLDALKSAMLPIARGYAP